MNFKKVLAMVLSLMMVLTTLSGFCAFAAETDAKITEMINDYKEIFPEFAAGYELLTSVDGISESLIYEYAVDVKAALKAVYAEEEHTQKTFSNDFTAIALVEMYEVINNAKYATLRANLIINYNEYSLQLGAGNGTQIVPSDLAKMYSKARSEYIFCNYDLLDLGFKTTSSGGSATGTVRPGNGDGATGGTTTPEDTTKPEDVTTPEDTTKPEDTTTPEDTTKPEDTTTPDAPVVAPSVSETFVDVPADYDWAAGAIDRLAAKGILSGKGETATGGKVFDPASAVTRNETAKLVAHIFELEAAIEHHGMADVHDSHWATDYVGSVVKSGAMTGYPDGTFRGDNNITRQEVAVTIARALGSEILAALTEGKADVEFKDVDAIGDWAIEYIKLLAKAGIFIGDTEGNFNPEQNLTRAESAVLYDRVDALLATK